MTYVACMSNAILRNKIVSNRKARPYWATDDKQLMLRCVGKRHMIRFQIAQMYWQKNMTAKDIAAYLGMNTHAVEVTISRLLTAL